MSTGRPRTSRCAQVGRRIREAFIAPGLSLVSADYSQIELRILAHLSKDPQLIEAFLEDKDIHVQTAAAIYRLRPNSSPMTCGARPRPSTSGSSTAWGRTILPAKALGITFANAQKFIETYFSQFPSVKEYLDSTVERARSLGYTETMFGRRRYLPDSMPTTITFGPAPNVSPSIPQSRGSAANIIKIAMIAIAGSIGTENKRAKMLLQVHDKLVFEVP